MESSIPIGAMIGGRWEITGFLGEGGFGQVFSAVDTSEVALGHAAVKVLHPNTTPRERQAFLTEVKKIATLRHPNLVGYLDSGQMDSGQMDSGQMDSGRMPKDGPAGFELRPYLVTERCAISLADHAKRSDTGTLSAAETLAVVADLTAGLIHLHQQGLIHRDIKPGNALYADGRWKLADFGLMRDLTATGSYHRAGDLMGTPLFMSPELFASMMATPASDVYAMGVLAHLCATGKHVHTGAGALLVHNVATLPPTLDSSLPPELHTIVARCTHLDPSARPTTAELGQLIEATRNGRPVALVGGAPIPVPPAGFPPPAPATVVTGGPDPSGPFDAPVPPRAGSGAPRVLVLLGGALAGLALVGVMAAGLFALTGSPDPPIDTSAGTGLDTAAGPAADGPAAGSGVDSSGVDSSGVDSSGVDGNGTGSGVAVDGSVSVGPGVSVGAGVEIGRTAPTTPGEIVDPLSHLVTPLCEGGAPTPTVEVENIHTTPVDYYLTTFHFDSAGVRIEESFDVATAIAPGQRAVLRVAPVGDDAASVVTCELSSLTARALDASLSGDVGAVTIRSCTLDDFFGNYYDIDFTITNPRDATVDAVVTFAVVDAEGVIIDQSIGSSINSIAPDQTVAGETGDFYSNIDHSDRAVAQCSVSAVALTPT